MQKKFGQNFLINAQARSKLIDALNASKNVKQGVLIHVMTTKGKGYQYAEEDPKSYHGISSFDIESGEPISSKKGFSAHFGELLCGFAEKDSRICAITAAMKIGTGLANFSHKYRERFFDVGIAEEHAVTFAAGLACEKMVPVFAVYSSFIQRSYDQIVHDVAAQDLHVILAIDRSGIVGEDGDLTDVDHLDVLCLLVLQRLDGDLRELCGTFSLFTHAYSSWLLL